jgi:hypothetical protein
MDGEDSSIYWWSWRICGIKNYFILNFSTDVQRELRY